MYDRLPLRQAWYGRAPFQVFAQHCLKDVAVRDAERFAAVLIALVFLNDADQWRDIEQILSLIPLQVWASKTDVGQLLARAAELGVVLVRKTEDGREEFRLSKDRAEATDQAGRIVQDLVYLRQMMTGGQNGGGVRIRTTR